MKQLHASIYGEDSNAWRKIFIQKYFCFN
jgi:hypothetical protein